VAGVGGRSPAPPVAAKLEESDTMNQQEASLGRWHQFNYFIDAISPTLSPIARDVWLAMFRHADTMGITTATRSRIADILGVSTVSVSSGISRLKEAGLIAKIPNRNGYILSLDSKENLTEQLRILNSKESLTVKNPLHPPLRILNTPCKESLTQTVKNPLHITEHTEHIQNLTTEKNTKEHSQERIKGTSKMDWQTKAANSHLFEALKRYPNVPHKGDARQLQSIWDDAAKEEGGHDELWYIVSKHIDAAKASKQWLDGYVPSFRKYITERRYKVAQEVKRTPYDSAHNIDELM
jgi:DNA-binding MarR family transcriptional regulator